MSEVLQGVVDALASRDVKDRLRALSELDAYMRHNKISDDLGYILDTLTVPLKDNNFKVCESAINTLGTCLSEIDDPSNFRLYFNMILPIIAEKLGDSKNIIRDKALDTVLYIAHICTAKDTFTALIPCFTHKNNRVREAILIAFRKTIVQYGPSSALFKQILPDIINMLNDPIGEVRESAIQCLETMYKYVGEELKHELHKSKVIRPSQMKDIDERLSHIELEADKLISLFKKSAMPSPRAKKKLPRSASTDQIAFVDPNHIDPICFANEKELSDDIEQVIVVLNDTKGDWNKRLTALKHLQGLVYGGCTQFPGFTALLHTLKEPLSKQLCDLRSSITKECCNLINVLVKQMGDEFEVFGDYFIPSLFKLVIVTVQVMADSGNQCARIIISNTKLNKSVTKIFENASNKTAHAILRNRCSEYMVLMLEETPTSSLDRFADQFFTALKLCLGDATAGVRANARKCFHLSQNHWRERAKKFYTTLDPSTQKAIADDEQKMSKMNTSDSSMNDSTDLTARPKSSHSNRPRGTGMPVSKPRTAEPVYGIPKSKSSSAFIETTMLDLTTSETNQESLKPPKTTTTQKKNTSIAAAKKAWLAKRQPVKQEEDSMDFVLPKAPTTRHAPSRTQSIDEDHVMHEQKYHPLVPNATPSKPSTPALKTTPSHKSPAPVTHEPLSARSTSELSSTGKQRLVPSNSDHVTLSSSDTVTSILKDAKVHLSSNGTGGASSAKTNEQPWSDRVLCCKKLLLLVQSNDRWPEITSKLSDVMSVLIDKYALDPHYKVVEQCLILLEAMVTRYQQAFEPYLERLFVRILVRLADTKETIANSASRLLVSICNNYSGDTLIPALLKVLDNSNTKIKLACLEIFLQIMNSCATYLAYPSHMKQCIMKLNAQLVRCSNALDIVAATAAALHFLYRISDRTFLEQLSSLPLNEQTVLKSALGKHIPNLEGELSKITRGRTTSGGQRLSGGNTILAKHEYVPEQNENVHAEPVQTTPVLTKAKSNGTLDRQRPTTNGTVSTGNDMPTLLAALTTKAKQLDAKSLKAIAVQLRGISQNKADSDEMWSLHFAKLIFAVLDLIHHEEEGVREEFLYLIKSLLQHHPIHFVESSTDALTFKRVMHKYSDPVKAVHAAAEKVAETFIQKIEPTKSLEYLESMLLNAHEAILLGALRLFRLMIVATRNQQDDDLNPDLLRAHVPKILPSLTEAFNHDNPDIRKAVVYCLAEMLFTVGEQFQPLLSKRLSQNQVKLVMVYHQQLKTIQQARQTENDRMEEGD